MNEMRSESNCPVCLKLKTLAASDMNELCYEHRWRYRLFRVSDRKGWRAEQ